MKKQLFVFLAFICAFSQASADSNYAIWENQYAKLSVFPNESVVNSPSQYHLQFANITNKMDTVQTINFSFVFPEQLVLGEIQYLQLIEILPNGTKILNWVSYTDQMTYIEFGGKHYYYSLNVLFQANSNRYVRWVYKTQSESGKWDLVIWRGSIFDPTLKWELDPYWSGHENITTNELAYWNMDETDGSYCNDSLLKYNGTIVGATIAQDGKINNSYSFDGTADDDYINMGSDSAFDFTTNNFSVSLWCKPDNTGVNNRVIVSRGEWKADGWEVSMNTEEVPMLYTSQSGARQYIYTSTSLADGNWHFVVIVRDTSAYKGGRIYVDGVEKSVSGESLINPATSSRCLTIGNSAGGLGDWHEYDGYLDELGIWNRALSTDEIVDLYYEGIGTTYNFSRNYMVTDGGSFGDVQVDTEQNVTLTLTSELNPIIIKNYTCNDSRIYLKDFTDIVLSAGSTNTTILYFKSSLYIDSNITANLTFFGFNASDVTVLVRAMSSTPTLTYYNTSDFGDCQVDTHSANLSILVTLGDFSCPNNVSLLAYNRNDTQFYMYFNLSTVNGSQNVSYNVYLIPSIYYDSDFIGAYSFSVDETYGAIDNESLIMPFWGYSSTPSLTYSTQNIDFGHIEVGKTTPEEYLNLTNIDSPNNITVTGITLNSNFTDVNNTFNYTIGANSYLLMYFTATPQKYADSNFNVTFIWSIFSGYGEISQDSAYLSYTSTTPELLVSSENYNVNFGNVVLDTTSDLQCIEYYNNGSINNLTISNVSINLDFDYSAVSVTGNFGHNWTATESIRNWRAVSVSSTGQYQTATVWSGSIYISSNYGVNWSEAFGGGSWYGVSLSSTGQYQTAVAGSNGIYGSSDYGQTWSAKKIQYLDWNGVSVSSSGQYQTAVSYDYYIQVSSDYGESWATKGLIKDWRAVSISSSGQYQTAVIHNGQIYISNDYGQTWTIKESVRLWRSISVSSTGQYQTTVVYNGQIYISSDYGDTWTVKESNRGWWSVSLSDTGQNQTAVASGGYIYISSDYGQTWTAKASARSWRGVSVSSTGRYQTVLVNDGQIYVSSDYEFIDLDITLQPQSSVILCYLATPTGYYDQLNSSVLFDFVGIYGQINYSDSTISYRSSQPILSNIDYSYNGSYTNILPEDTLSFEFAVENQNLNTVQIKTYTWTLLDCTLNTNFSVMTSAQCVYNSTYSILGVIREVTSFSQRVQSVNIWFYGIGSENSNNVFNLSISPNFTMINFSYIFPILTSLPDCDIDTQYSNTWILYNNFGPGGIDFDLVTRTDTNAFNVTKYYNIDNATSSGHLVNLINIYQLTFYATSYQAELFINLYASDNVDILITINNDISDTQTISITGGTPYKPYKIYLDTLIINKNNTLTLELSGSSGLSLYIQNASHHPEMHISKFDWATADFISMPNTGMAIDIIMSELLMRYETPRFYDYEDNLTIQSEDSNTWNLYYYPHSYTDTYLSTTINFVLIDNVTRRYLDNFSMIIRCNTPRKVDIVSDLSTLYLTLYAGEENEFKVQFENIGTIDCKISTLTSSVSWIKPFGYENVQLEMSTPQNITFKTTSELTSEYIDYNFVFEISLTTTHNGSYSESTDVYIIARANLVIVTPSTYVRAIERKAGADKIISFVIRNDGLASGTYTASFITEPEGIFHNSLSLPPTFSLDAESDEYLIEFTLSGSNVAENETWIILLEGDIGDNITLYIYATTIESAQTAWYWLFAVLMVGLCVLAIFAYFKIKANRANDRDSEKIKERETNLKNIEKSDISKDEKKLHKKRNKTMGLRAKITMRNIAIFAIFGVACIIIIISVWYSTKSDYEPVWEPLNQFWDKVT